MRQTMKEWTMPNDMRAEWKINNSEQVACARNLFQQYLSDGWLAYRDESGERIQILKFDPKFERIILLPPLGGG